MQVLPQKAIKGQVVADFFGWTSRSKNNQTLWKSPVWDSRSLYDPDVLRRTSHAFILWWCIMNKYQRKHHSRSGGDTGISTKLRDSSCIFIRWATFQSCYRIQRSTNRNATCRVDWHWTSQSMWWFNTHHQPGSWGLQSLTWRLGSLSQCNHQHGK